MGCRDVVVIKPVNIKILYKLTSKYFNKKNKNMFKLKEYRKKYLTNFRLLRNFNKITYICVLLFLIELTIFLKPHPQF
jgi:hypothetical protein